AAEELVLNEPSTGSESDLERATHTARDMAGRYGMSERLGRAHVLKQQGEVFLGRDYMAGQEISQPTLEHLDAEVRSILEAQESVARTIVSSNLAVLHRLASTLIAQETLQGEPLDEVLAAVSPHRDGLLAPDAQADSR
ncbi:MAG TPA: hypothetical protein VG184_06215, partial [Acidimicrobiales bacterium]|nr:hypothetical protein [Acidimicrobiales bacterium]